MHSETVSFSNEVGRGLDSDTLPAYAPMLAAYHRAHACELQAIISMLPINPGDRVMDIACGDGTYVCWLAERVGSSGAVIGVDISPAYLKLAEQRAAASPHAPNITFRIGAVERLPFDDNTFDLVWCAHSFYSLPDPIVALDELRRVVRPGGTIAVLENDTLHRVVIPWPPELELAVRRAQLMALDAASRHIGKFFIGRQLCTVFDAAGLRSCTITPLATVRHAPLSADEHTYLTWYFQDLGTRARPYLEPTTRDWFDMLFNPESELCLLTRPDFYAMYIDMLACGSK